MSLHEHFFYKHLESSSYDSDVDFEPPADDFSDSELESREKELEINENVLRMIEEDVL